MPDESRTSDIAPVGFFMLRTPLLPWARWTSLAHGLEASSALDDGPLREALARDRAAIHARLRALVARGEIREALYLASVSVTDRIALWAARPASRQGRKLERTLVRYLARMSYRCTPFGLFAGTAVGDIADDTHLSVPELAACRRYVRVDNDYLFALVNELLNQHEIRGQLAYVPNSTVYVLGDAIRYVERHLRAGRRYDELVHADATDVVLALLERARTGATRAQLARTILDQVPDVDREEAEGFVSTLIDDQLLIAELGPAVTGDEPLDQLIDSLSASSSPVSVLKSLTSVRRALHELSWDPPIGAIGGTTGETTGDRIEAAYQRALQPLRTLSLEHASALPIQVDMHKSTSGLTLGKPIVQAIERGLHVLHRLTVPRPPPLQAFARAFRARYGAREVPMTEALDPEVGIGLDERGQPGKETPVLRDIRFPGRAPSLAGQPELQAGLARRERYVFRLAERAWREQRDEIRLTSADIDALSVGQPQPLPDSFAVLARVTSRSEDALRAGRFRVHIRHGFGPSGANQLGRFCHGDGDVHRRVRDLLRAEQAMRPEAIFAEIVHLPAGHTGNVVLRPVLRDCEIPYLGISGAPRERQISISELLVSVGSDLHITLRSRRLGKEIIPRLSTAHDYASSKLAGYRFLCFLQHQGCTRYLGFSWGPLADRASYLPRVVAGRALLCPRRWYLDARELTGLATGDDVVMYREAQRLRAAYRLPQHVGICEEDHVLPVNLDNVASIDTLAHAARGQRDSRRDIRLVELLEDDLVVAGPGGAYTHELVIPFSRVAPPGQADAGRPGVGDVSAVPSIPRWVPGDTRMLMRLFTGPATGDWLLGGELPALMERARADGLLERWFYLRRERPEPHICLVACGQREALCGQLLARIAEVTGRLLARARISRAQLDTYDPANVLDIADQTLIEPLERVNHLDSLAVLPVLAGVRGDAGLSQRFHLALFWAARALEALVPSLADRVRFASAHYRRQSTALGVADDVQVRRGLGDRYRSERNTLDTLIHPGGQVDDIGPESSRSLADHATRHFAPVMRAIADVARAHRDLSEVAREEVAASMIAQHCARMLCSRHDEQALVLWHTLMRAYQSQAAAASGSQLHRR